MYYFHSSSLLDLVILTTGTLMKFEQDHALIDYSDKHFLRNFKNENQDILKNEDFLRIKETICN